MDAWSVFIRGADYVPMFEVSDYITLEAHPRFNDEGTWQIVLDKASPAAGEFTFDRGLILELNGEAVCSGPVKGLRREWDGDQGTDSVIVNGLTDDTWLLARLAYPEAPAMTAATDRYDIRTGVASTIMGEYVDNNLGPSADTTRRVAGLTIATDPVIGGTVTGRGRWQSVMHVLRNLSDSSTSGHLGFRLIQRGTGISFEVYEPADLTDRIRFNKDLGTVASFIYEEAAPPGTWVVILGDDKTPSPLIQGGDTDLEARYGRLETFSDEGDTPNGDLPDLLVQRLAELEAAAVSFEVKPTETGSFEFGTDYGLGDIVLAVADDQEVEEPITEVAITLDENGATVVPLITQPGGASVRVPKFFDRLATLEQRVKDMERRFV